MAVSDMRCFDEVLTLTSRWDIGADGAHTKSSGIPGTGFTSVSRDKAGAFTVNFARGIPIGPLVELRVQVWKATDTEGVTVRPTDGSYVAETAAAAASVKFEVWDVDETAVQIDPASGDTVSITAVFLKTKAAS